MTKKITKEFLKETIKRLLSEQPTSTRGMGDMTGFGISALKNAEIDGGGMKKPEAARKILDIAKKNPKTNDILNKGILPHLALDQPVKTNKRYGVMPDLTAYETFNSAYGVAKKMVVPFFYFGKGRKYKIFSTGAGSKPFGTEEIERAFGQYFSEYEAELQDAMDSLSRILNPVENAEAMAAFKSLKPDGALDGIEGAGSDMEKMVAPKDPPGKELEEADAFAPSHYCVHHGGVQHEGKVVPAEAVQHNYNKKLGKVTHYDMKLPDGTILENIAAEDIQVTNATLAEGHGGHKMKKDDELEEGGKNDDKDGKEERCDYVKCDESKIQTPEQEDSLYESRFAERNNRLFENLSKKWTK